MFGFGILTYIKIGVVVALVGVGSYFYLDYRHTKAENVLLTRQLAGYKRAVKILKEDLKTDEVTDHEKEIIDGLTPEQLPAYFDKLRQRARPDKPADTD